MPIYTYRCNSCGFEKDHLQKLNDPVLTDCPECKTSNYAKQLTAAGFQLKGNGWYATDFKSNDNSTPRKTETTDSAPPCAGGNGACACAGS